MCPQVLGGPASESTGVVMQNQELETDAQCCIKYFKKVFQIHVKLLSCKSILNTVENTVLQKYLKY